MQTNQTPEPPRANGLGLVARTAMGVSLAGTGVAFAQDAAVQPVQATGAAAPPVSADLSLPTIAVESAPNRGGQGYQATLPASGKLTQRLLDTPQSVAEVPRALLDDQGITTLRDALRNVPGVSLAAGEGGQQGDNLSIRGFNAQNDFYLDGVRDFGSYFRDPFNLERVEVLKGPSSVLFGRGSTGGVINEVSKQPQLAPVTAGAIQLGTDGTHRVTTDVNRAVGPNAAVRLNLMANENGVAGRNDAEYRRFGVAPEIALGIGTPTRLVLDYLHQQSYDTPDFGIPWLNGRPAPVNRKNFYGYDLDGGDYFATRADIVTAKVEHDFGDTIKVDNQLRYGSYGRRLRGTEGLINSYGTTGIVNLNRVPLDAVQVGRHELALNSTETLLDDQTNVTVRVATGPLVHNIVGGFEVARQTSDPTRYNIGYTYTNLLRPTGAAFTLAQPVSTLAHVVANNYAFYAVDTINIGRYVDLIAGWRWDRYNSTYAQVVRPVSYVSRNDDLPTYRAALVVKPTPYASAYVSYGTSFNPSAEALSLSASTAAVAPEKSRNIEVGGKIDVLGGRLSLTAALYDLEKANARETDPNNSTLSILAGDYHVQGFEIGAAGHLTDRWQVFGGYSYNDAEVVKSPNPAELHHSPPNAPRHTFTVFTEYQLPWYGIEVGAGVNYVSSRTASSTPVSGTALIERAPGYVLAQLMAKKRLTENLTLQANLYNISNEYYYDGLHPAHVIPGGGRAALFTLAAGF